MIKVGIMEDEPEIRKILRKIIEKQDGFQVVFESDSFSTSITEFTKYRPDVIFVDIDLNGESGLECAKILSELDPKLKIIFATAHSEYMANAFEIYAFDYLVKPFDIKRVTKTLLKIKNASENNMSVSESVSEVILPHQERQKEKLMIKGKEQVVFIDKSEIIMIERNNQATCIWTKEECYKTSVSLGSIESKLDSREFMRCHKSYIINLSMVTRIEPYGRWTYLVKLKGIDETALLTAQNYEEIKKIFS